MSDRQTGKTDRQKDIGSSCFGDRYSIQILKTHSLQIRKTEALQREGKAVLSHQEAGDGIQVSWFPSQVLSLLSEVTNGQMTSPRFWYKQHVL